MAHLLDLEALADRGPVGRAADDDDEGSGSRLAVRLLGCAVALLIVSFLVVSRSSSAFRSDEAATSTAFRSGTLLLRDDDGGSAMFDLPALVPGESGERCITVSYEGDVGPAVMALRAEGGGALADSLAVSIEGGRGGAFGDCAAFEPDARLYEGTLGGFLDRYDRRSEGLVAHTFPRGEGAQSFRFRFHLPPEFEDQGATAAADFFWTATPLRTG